MEIKVSDDWKIDLDSLRKLSREDFAHWIDCRLRGHDPYFPMGRDTEPYALFLGAFKRIPEEEFRERLREAVVELLHGPGAQIPDYFSCLLTLIKKFKAVGAANHLFRLAEAQLLRGVKSSYGDLHEQLLLTLASLKRLFPEEFWAREMDDLTYANAAFMGLFTCCGHDKAFQYLRTLVQKHLNNPEKVPLAYPLFFLLDQYGVDDTLDQIKEIFKDAPEAEKKAVRQELQSLGYQIPALDPPAKLLGEVFSEGPVLLSVRIPRSEASRSSP